MSATDEKQDGGLRATERIAVPQRGPGPAGAMGAGEKAMAFVPSARRLLRRMRPQRAKATLVILLAIGSVTLMSLGPWLLGRATDLVFAGYIGRQLPGGQTAEQAETVLRASGQGDLADLVSGMSGLVPGQGVDFGAVGRALLVVLAVYVAAAALAWLQGWLLNDVVQSTIRELRADVERKIHAMPLATFDKAPRGELLSRVTNDIDNVGQTLQQTMSQLLTSLLTVVGILVMMLWISPLLAVVALVAVPVSLLLTGAVMKRSQPQFVTQWRRTGSLNAHVEESISGHALVTVMGRRTAAEETFAEQNDALYDASYRAQFVSGLLMPVMMLIGNISYVVVAVVGAFRVTAGAITIGDVQAFIQYSRQFNQPLTTVASMTNLLQSGVASAERVFELLDADEEMDATVVAAQAAAAAKAPRGHGEVAFEHVSFSYSADRPLIEDLSLVARPGQTVAIVGPTGAGKTTLVNLVLRFYELDAGRITLDGVDVTELSRHDLRAQTGMVLQDTWLFEGTIRDNIAYGRPGASEDDILEAARATYVDRFVGSLPDGYDTVVTENGENLSAGERQLLTIARAFLADPALLILDEATSSVDTRTELLLQKAMGALRQDRTSFVIAHRLSTIRDADVILVMEAGSIVEQGTHRELLEADGAYAALYRSQFAASAID
ncbi:ABC transporter ATP-binding protein [Nocardioides sp. CPCC 205120]|uniref:ABC transporter ATP-binding protein n=1 Tax=Nocardioides sp. CPCC 205120 TaxID=3406462 RepID=UPI003B51536D